MKWRGIVIALIAASSLFAACGVDDPNGRTVGSVSVGGQSSSSDACDAALLSTEQPVNRAADALRERIIASALAASINNDGNEMRIVERYAEEFASIWPSIGASGRSRYQGVSDLLALADKLGGWDRDSKLDGAVDDLRFAERTLSVCL